MTNDVPETIQIDGHTVNAHDADLFFHQNDGRRLTDAEWDEIKRVRADDSLDRIPEEWR